MRLTRLSLTLLAATPAIFGSLTAESPAPASEADQEKDKRFKLGEVTVVVTDKLEVPEQVNTKLEAEKVQAFNRDNVGTALTLLPGITFTVNPRNEQLVFVRGNDSRRVPVFMDGVPMYVPYEGQVDFGRFTTFDLSEIQVAKGFSSVLYGPNTLGGAINLVTRKPTEKLEGQVTLGAFDGQGKKAALNIGSRLEKFYVQAGLSQLDAGDFRMSSNFTPTVREDGGRRENTDSKDRKVSLKLGWTPVGEHEFVLGFVDQKGEKGQPVATDPSVQARYWRWPNWDKRGAYLTTNSPLGKKSYVRFRAYYDTYKNTLNAFTDGTYTKLATTGSFGPTGISVYDDFTRGAMAEFGTMLIPNHSLRAVVQIKTDVHRDDNGTNAWKSYQDAYQSAGLEDSISVGKDVDLSLGLGWDKQKPENSGTYRLTSSKSMVHGQIGCFWRIRPDWQVYVTAAQKNRFPTLKDRYSLRLNTYIENIDLQPERSVNYEIGLKAKPFKWMEVEAALFRSDIKDLIQEVKFVQGQKSQLQNIGEVRHTGAELSLGLKPLDCLMAGLSYMYLDRDNLSNPTTRLTGTPRNRVFGYVRYEPLKEFFVLASVENQAGLWDSNTVFLSGYAEAGLTIGWTPLKDLNLEAGLRNALDRDYQLAQGYPMPGRSWFVNTRYRF